MPHFARLLLAAALAFARPAGAGEITLAVAANFTAPMQAIAAEFARDTGHVARPAFGATGTLYAQISRGAPFDLFLAADEETPARLESESLAVAGSRFVYATGRLVLWSPRPDGVDRDAQVLRTGAFAHLAVANPRTSPYGSAALAVLDQLGLKDALARRLVIGESIAQTYQFVASGNAALGFVALSQVSKDGRLAAGSAWIVPAHLHRPLRQEAVLLLRGRDKPAARAFLDYLRGAKARAIIRTYGYES